MRQTALNKSLNDWSGTTGTVTVVAATNVFTLTAHGLEVGDAVEFTTTTTLPDPLVAGTSYYVITVPTANTFTISATKGGVVLDITDTGIGTHTVYEDKIIYLDVQDYGIKEIAVSTGSSFDATLYFRGSIQDTAPDMLLAKSATNQWDNLDFYSLQNGTSIDGDTGVAYAGTDNCEIYKIQADGIKWLSVVLTKYVAGTATVEYLLADNE